jgi:membrane protein implicated in regulation of membrane protease activity
MGVPLLWLGGIAALWYYEHIATAPGWLPAAFTLLLLLGTALVVRCVYLLRTERPQPYDERGAGGSGPVLW